MKLPMPGRVLPLAATELIPEIRPVLQYRPHRLRRPSMRPNTSPPCRRSRGHSFAAASRSQRSTDPDPESAENPALTRRSCAFATSSPRADRRVSLALRRWPCKPRTIRRARLRDSSSEMVLSVSESKSKAETWGCEGRGGDCPIE